MTQFKETVFMKPTSMGNKYKIIKKNSVLITFCCVLNSYKPSKLHNSKHELLICLAGFWLNIYTYLASLRMIPLVKVS